MRRQVIASAAALALFTTFDGAGFAIAQDTGGGAGTPQTTNILRLQQLRHRPPVRPQRRKHQVRKLPEVQVIQEQPKPKPKPVKQAAKPKPKPAPVVAAQPAAARRARSGAGSAELRSTR